MGKFFLGPLMLKWCTTCNLPIIMKNRCGICGGKSIIVDISPPGDIRPALPGDLQIIRGAVNDQYGQGLGEKLIPSNKIIILNKISSLERSEEVVVDGRVIGIIDFNPLNLKWSFIPKLEAARRLIDLKLQKYVQVDAGAESHIISGANVLAPGIVEYDYSITAEEYVAILNHDRRVIGVGISKFNGSEYNTLKKGMVVKTKRSSPPLESDILPGGQTWDDVVKANEKHLQTKIDKSVKTIKNAVLRFQRPAVVAFSGGKDSQCVLALTREALKEDFWVMFIDTGIEFKETLEHVQYVIDKLGLKQRFIYKKSRGDFWREINNFGPPARDFRFCCKILKLSAVAEAIEENFKGEIISLTGQRRYESIPRSKERTVWINPYVPNQINVAPIRDWTALHVWLYLYRSGIPLNRLYYEGYERIGCMFCPATKLSELSIMERAHPEEYRKWLEFLSSWADKYGYKNGWAVHGFWRWKNPGAKQQHLASVLGVNLKADKKMEDEMDLKFSVTAGISPCRSGGYIIEGKFNKGLDLERISSSLSSIGEPKYSQALGILYLKRRDYALTLFAEGSLKLNIAKKELEREVLDKVIKLIIRAIKCTECNICLKVCPQSVIKIVSGKVIIDKSKCSGCLKCLDNCPAINYTLPYIFE